VWVGTGTVHEADVVNENAARSNLSGDARSGAALDFVPCSVFWIRPGRNKPAVCGRRVRVRATST